MELEILLRDGKLVLAAPLGAPISQTMRHPWAACVLKHVSWVFREFWRVLCETCGVLPWRALSLCGYVVCINYAVCCVERVRGVVRGLWCVVCGARGVECARDRKSVTRSSLCARSPVVAYVSCIVIFCKRQQLLNTHSPAPFSPHSTGRMVVRAAKVCTM